MQLKIVLLGDGCGLVESRQLENACMHIFQFIALSGGSHPGHNPLVMCCGGLGDAVKALFHSVLLVCEGQD